MPELFEYVATCLFGLEKFVGDEIEALGYTRLDTMDGRVTFKADISAAARFNLWSRTAEHLYIKMGEFDSPTFDALFESIKALPWERWIGRDDAFPVKGHSIQSLLTSIPDCQSIVKKAIVSKLTNEYGISWFEETGPKHQIEFFIYRDKATLMIDTTGAPLYKRGYRTGTNDAPLRETLAAAMVKIARPMEHVLLWDPMAGSGTIPIEAAMIMTNTAPGINRSFEIEQFDDIPNDLFKTARAEARDLQNFKTSFEAFASDNDRNSVELAIENVKNAGMENHVKCFHRNALDIIAGGRRGTIVCNPPYGERLLDKERARELYKGMGKTFATLDKWQIYIITSDDEFEKFYGRRADKIRKLYNGMIKCNYYQFFKPAENRNFQSDEKIKTDDIKSTNEQISFDKKEASGEQKPFDRNKTSGEHKPFDRNKTSGEHKPFDRNKTSGEHKPFDRNKTSGEYKPFDRNKTSGEYKPFDRNKSSGEHKPFDRNKTSGEHKPFDRNKNYKDRKPYDNSKPFREYKKVDKTNPKNEQEPFDRNKASGEYKPFDRNKTSGEHKPFDRNKTSGEHKPFDRNKTPGEYKPFDRNKASGEHKPFDRNKFSGERKPFDRNKASGEYKPFDKNKTSGEHKPFDRNKFSGERKPFDRNKASGEHKPFDRNKFSGEHKPFDKNKTSGEHKPFEKNKFSGEHKPFDRNKTSGEHKPFDRNKTSGEHKPFDKNKTSGEYRPFDKNKSSGERKFYVKEKSFTGKKTFDNKKTFNNNTYKGKTEEKNNTDK